MNPWTLYWEGQMQKEGHRESATWQSAAWQSAAWQSAAWQSASLK